MSILRKSIQLSLLGVISYYKFIHTINGLSWCYETLEISWIRTYTYIFQIGRCNFIENTLKFYNFRSNEFTFLTHARKKCIFLFSPKIIKKWKKRNRLIMMLWSTVKFSLIHRYCMFFCLFVSICGCHRPYR